MPITLLCPSNLASACELRGPKNYWGINERCHMKQLNMLGKETELQTIRKHNEHNLRATGIRIWPSENRVHFLLKCATCFELERMGKSWDTERPDGNGNIYDVYCTSNGIPLEVFESISWSLGKVQTKRQKYLRKDLVIVTADAAPESYLLERKIYPIWIFKFDTQGWTKYNTTDDLREALVHQYDDFISFFYKHKTPNRMSREFKEILQKMKTRSLWFKPGVTSPTAIKRWISKIEHWGLFKYAEQHKEKFHWIRFPEEESKR